MTGPVAWPAEVRQRLVADGSIRLRPAPAARRTPLGQGRPAKVRRSTAAPGWIYSGNLRLPWDQYGAFRDWYYYALQGGSLPFSWEPWAGHGPFTFLWLAEPAGAETAQGLRWRVAVRALRLDAPGPAAAPVTGIPAVPWPAGVPQALRADGSAQNRWPSQALRSPEEQGLPPLLRHATRYQLWGVSGTLTLTWPELERLMTWYCCDLAGGVLPFVGWSIWEDAAGEIPMRWTAEPEAHDTARGMRWIVAVQAERLGQGGVA